jgi:prepilin-type N-terminal cleavage/methylation domain-containing protein/prepilin-type processing-associated H-X9-DG protein
MRNKDIMFRSRGFTLVELLVVISIIALLMAVLLPGLAAARRQAKNVKDMMNLRQWGVMLTMFAQDRDGKLMVGWNGGEMWTASLMKYYKGSDNICLCPMASTVFRSSFPPNYHFRGTDNADQTFIAWGKYGVNGYPTNAAYGEKDGMYGSYGINGWVYDALDAGVPGTYSTTGPPDTRPNYWRTINVKNADKIPLFGDCMYDGGTPEASDPPSQFKGTELNAASGTDTSIYCIDRHQGGTNMTFMDGSVRKVGLKELWRLKWHRKFNTNVSHPSTFWPQWMQGLQDYPPVSIPNQ